MGSLLCVCSINVKSYTILFIGRVICGLTAGLNNVIIMCYIKEVSPDALTQETQFDDLAAIYTKTKGIK